MREAYSHEVISHGFWFGSGPVLEPAFYAYAVPEPPGLKAARVQPRGAFYHGELGEFILPYETVQQGRFAGACDHRVRRQHLRSGGDARAVESGGARTGARDTRRVDGHDRTELNASHSALRERRTVNAA